MSKTLTISIAAYNAEKYIERCLKSFVNSSVLEDLEIIVVDDGSTDSTAYIARKYCNLYPKSIYLVNKSNGGHGSTINQGILEAKGKFFKTVDADDWVDIDGINQLVDALKRINADLVINPYMIVNEKEEVTNEINIVDNNGNVIYGKEYSVNEIGKYITIAMHAVTFRTDVLKSLELKISEKCFYVDTEYTVFPLIHVNTVCVLEFPVYMYLLGTQEQSMNMKNMIKRRDQHLKVLIRVMEFYMQRKDEMGDGVKAMIIDRLIDITRMHYVILFSLDDLAVGKNEVIQFDEMLKSLSEEMYDKVLSKKHNSMTLLSLLRKRHFTGYIPIMKVLHTLKLI